MRGFVAALVLIAVGNRPRRRAAGGREVLTAVGTAVAGLGAVVGVAAAFWIIGRSEDREREGR